MSSIILVVTSYFNDYLFSFGTQFHGLFFAGHVAWNGASNKNMWCLSKIVNSSLPTPFWRHGVPRCRVSKNARQTSFVQTSWCRPSGVTGSTCKSWAKKNNRSADTWDLICPLIQPAQQAIACQPVQVRLHTREGWTVRNNLRCDFHVTPNWFHDTLMYVVFGVPDCVCVCMWKLEFLHMFQITDRLWGSLAASWLFFWVVMSDTGLQKRLWHFFHYFGSIVLQGHHLEMSVARTSIIEAEGGNPRTWTRESPGAEKLCCEAA